MPITTLGLWIGAATLAGVPPLAAFFSKEHILHALDAPELQVYLFAVYAAAFLTAYYSFRMVFLVTRPNPDSAAVADEPAYSQHADATHEGVEDHAKAHEPWSMRGPILILSAFAAGTGFLGERIAHLLGIEHIHHAAYVEMIPAFVIVALGVAAAWIDFGRKRARQTGVVARFAPAQKLFENRWYLDVIYNAVFVRAAVGIARLCYTTETRGLDGAADGVAEGTAEAGVAVAKAHSGRLQLYIGTAVVLVAALTLYIGLR
jgi:NADH:ubiquinone oxidoreductase subunit 5 (subunit L)/multisubunit Na+/H+ antiporter MnhA subunit